MPDTLYIQADNSGKDNKNNYVLVFLAYLVYKGVFKKIKLNFLMVGHTHEDIDAVFSRVGKKLKMLDAPTLPKLHHAVRTCIEPAPVVNYLGSVWDYRAKCVESPIHYTGFQGVHHFTFKMKEDRLKLLYKDWPSDEYTALDMTVNVADLNFDLVVVAQMNQKVVPVISSLEGDIQKYSKAGPMEENDQIWWGNYLQGIERSSRVRPITPLVHELPKFNAEHEIVMETNTLSAMRDHQRKLKQKSHIKASKRRS